MFKRFCLILSLVIGTFFLAVLPALAESVDTAWVRTYRGPGDSADVALAIAVDVFGNVYVTGKSWGGGAGFDYATIKYYPDGDTAWVRRYNGPGNGDDRGYAIAVDGPGNVYVTGYSDNGANHDYLTVIYYTDGKISELRYDGPGNGDDEAQALALDSSGNVYVTGYSWGSETDFDYATIKHYPNGDTAWVRRYDGPGNNSDEGKAIAVDDSGNVCVTGYSYGSGTYSDYATIKYYPNGDTGWVRRYNGPGDSTDVAWATAIDGSGNIYVSGVSDSTGTGYEGYDYGTIKYDSSGVQLWVKRYNGPGNYWDDAYAMAVDDFGNAYVTGYSCGSGALGDYATIKYYSNGDTAWVRRYNGPGDDDDEAWAIAVDDSGNVYVTGNSCGGGTYTDYATIMYDSSGREVWVAIYNGPGDLDDGANAIAVDGSGNVYVTGESGTVYDCDYATIKYVQNGSDVKEETGDREKPSEFALSQNYPNPFNQSTKIEFTLAKSGFINLNIYDILGRKIRSLISEKVSSGYKSVLWDGKNDSGKDVASGIYFYQLKVENPASGGVGDFTDAKKLVLLK